MNETNFLKARKHISSLLSFPLSSKTDIKVSATMAASLHKDIVKDTMDSRRNCCGVRKIECQPCCGIALSNEQEAKHEVMILGCGHIGCSLYQGAGNCIVCDSNQTSRRWSGILQAMSESKGSIGSTGFDLSTHSEE